MLKETKTEKNNSLFCDIFIIGSISIGGSPGSLAPPGYACGGPTVLHASLVPTPPMFAHKSNDASNCKFLVTIAGKDEL